MKIATQCNSPLLQRSLELFLDKYLSNLNRCDIVIRDRACLNDKRCFYIGSSEDADLKKPFSKAELILALERKFKELQPIDREESKSESEQESQGMDFSILEKRIELLTQEYQQNIIRAVKAFYEKQ